jgi:hypothetical protein
MRRELPAGTVTFLFTDLRKAFTAHGGVEAVALALDAVRG